MDDVRIGRSLRVLRRRRRWSQQALADRAGVAQTTISVVERGHLDRLSIRTVRRIFAAVDASFDGLVRWRGGEMDRLLDADHAAAVAETLGRLTGSGWETAVEVTFNHFGDRGSIDVLGFHPRTATALVVEVKSIITSAEETVRRLDVKTRLAPAIVAARFGRRPSATATLLSITASRSNRRRVEAASRIFQSALPRRGSEIRAWLRQPDGGMKGLLFVPVNRPTATTSIRR